MIPSQKLNDMKTLSNRISYVMYLLAMLIFGTNGYLVAHLSLQSGQIVLMRTLIGGALLTVLVLLRGGFDRENIQKDSRFILFGGVALGLNWVALFEAYRRLNVSVATLIYYAGPMLVLLFSPFLFHEKLNGKKIISVCIVALGLVCVTGSITSAGMSPRGLTTAGLSALFYALLIVCNKNITRTGGLQTAALELDLAFVVVLCYALVTVGLPHPLPSDWPYLLSIGAINTGLAYLLYFSGMQRLPAQSVALLSYVDPVSALIFSSILLHEQMTIIQTIGAVLIIGGAGFSELRTDR